MSKVYVVLESIEITNDHETIRPNQLDGCEPGQMVMVGPCGKKYGKKTFLGMYLCSAPTGFIGKQEGNKIVLEMTEYTNPAIYIPELREIVWGYGSWWSKVESED